MKKIFFFILIIMGFFAHGQKLQKPVTYGYEFPRVLVNTSFGLPKDTFPVPTLYQNEQWWASKNGSLYHWDTVAYIWKIFGSPSESCPPNGVLNGSASVTWQGTGFNFSVAPGLYMIDCVPYTSDSGTVVLATADPDFDRFDVIYLATDGAIHILTGEPSASAAIPQVQGDEIALTAILVPAASTAFEPNEQMIYNENTESVIINTGTTTNGANITNVYTGVFSFNVTNINNGDIIFFTKSPVPSTWDITGIDKIQIFIKLKAVMPTLANLRIAFYNGTTTAVSAEVIIPIDRNNITTYQAISIPISAFGNITTTQFTKIRVRYTSNNAANYTGFYGDRWSFVDNLPTLPPTGATVNLTLNSNGNGIVINPSNQIQNGGSWTLVGGGLSSHYIDGTLTTRAFPTLLDSIGGIDDRAKNANGLTIDNGVLYGHLANDLYPGFLSPAGYIRLNRNDSIQNTGAGDTLLVYTNDSLMKVKSLIAGTGVTFNVTGDDITINSSGSGLSDGDKGDITVSSSGSAWTIDNDVVTNAKLANMATQTFKGRTTAGTGDPEDLSISQAKSLLAVGLDDALSVGQALTTNRSVPTSAFSLTMTSSHATNTLKTVSTSSGGSGLYSENTSTGYGLTAINSGTGTAIGAFNNSSGSSTIEVENSGSGVGAFITSQGGVGLATQSNATNALTSVRFAAANNSVLPVVEIQRQVNGSAVGATGIGGSIEFKFPTTTSGSPVLANQLISKWTDATNSTRTSQLIFSGVNSASTVDILTLNGNKSIKANGYGSGTFTGTPAFTLQVDASGNFIEGSVSGGSGTVNTGAANRLAYYPGAGTTVDDLTAITANSLIASDVNGLPVAVSGVSDTEAGYLSNVTSDIQTQFGGKANTALSNLASVAINTTLVSDADNTDDLGTSAFSWKDAYLRRVRLDGSTSGTADIFSDALSNVISGTVISGTGTIPVDFDIPVRSDETLANSTSDQPLFTSTTHDVITIAANTTYDFTLDFDLSHGAVSHSLSFGMLPTTATISSIAYTSSVWTTAIGTGTNTQTSNRVKVTATTQIQAAGSVNVESCVIRGWFVVGNTGGSIMPTIKFSADPTGTILLKAGARFIMTARGNDTYTEKGPMN